MKRWPGRVDYFNLRGLILLLSCGRSAVIQRGNCMRKKFRCGNLTENKQKRRFTNVLAILEEEWKVYPGRQ